MKTYIILFSSLLLLCYSILVSNINLLGLSEFFIFSCFFVLYCKENHLETFKLVLYWIRLNYIQLTVCFFVGYFILFQFVVRSVFNF